MALDPFNMGLGVMIDNKSGGGGWLAVRQMALREALRLLVLYSIAIRSLLGDYIHDGCEQRLLSKTGVLQ